MLLRAISVLPLALLLIGPRADSLVSRQPSYSLRIEALRRDTLVVRLSATPVRMWVQPPASQVRTPFSASVSDSIGHIHIVVEGFAAVRVTLINRDTNDSLVSEGRDITLARNANGLFERVWTAQQLIP